MGNGADVGSRLLLLLGLLKPKALRADAGPTRQRSCFGPDCSVEISCSRFILKSPFSVKCMRVSFAKYMRVAISAIRPHLLQLVERLHYFPLKRLDALSFKNMTITGFLLWYSDGASDFAVAGS